MLYFKSNAWWSFLSNNPINQILHNKDIVKNIFSYSKQSLETSVRLEKLAPDPADKH